jgi:hypothetical protein
VRVLASFEFLGCQWKSLVDLSPMHLVWIECPGYYFASGTDEREDRDET